MNKILAVSGLVCFVIAHFVGFVPKSCLDKFNKNISRNNNYLVEMRMINKKLYIKYLAGLIVSTTFTVLAVILLLFAGCN